MELEVDLLYGKNILPHSKYFMLEHVTSFDQWNGNGRNIWDVSVEVKSYHIALPSLSFPSVPRMAWIRKTLLLQPRFWNKEDIWSRL